MKPLAIDLYAGLGGWSAGLIAEGYDVVGFDIERHEYGEHRYPAQLVIQDVLTLHGSQFKDAALIVALPPCQRYSWMAMPWSKAKDAAAAIRADTSGKMLADLTQLFDACFRIQAQASLAAGRHVPMVVENVKGAQPWVGRARWSFGTYFLWGDVPALMPIAKARKNTGGSWFAVANNKDSGLNNNPVSLPCGYKSSGMNWSDQTKRGQVFMRVAGRQAMEGRKAFPGGADGWFGDYAAMKEGVKQHGSGREWFAGDGKISRMTSSGSPARKAASAMIARIPYTLSSHIARVYRDGL